MNDAGPKGGEFLSWDFATRLLAVIDDLAKDVHKDWSLLERSEYEWAVRTLKRIATTQE